MALRPGGRPYRFDFTGFANEERTAAYAHEFAAHELLLLPGAEFFHGFVRGIAQQREVQLVLGLEGGQSFLGIGAHSKDGDFQLIELLFCVAKLGRFNGSTGSIGFGEKEQEDAVALKVAEGELRAFVRGQTEGRSFITDFKHENRAPKTLAELDSSLECGGLPPLFLLLQPGSQCNLPRSKLRE